MAAASSAPTSAATAHTSVYSEEKSEKKSNKKKKSGKDKNKSTLIDSGLFAAIASGVICGVTDSGTDVSRTPDENIWKICFAIREVTISLIKDNVATYLKKHDKDLNWLTEFGISGDTVKFKKALMLSMCNSYKLVHYAITRVVTGVIAVKLTENDASYVIPKKKELDSQFSYLIEKSIIFKQYLMAQAAIRICSGVDTDTSTDPCAKESKFMTVSDEYKFHCLCIAQAKRFYDKQYRPIDKHDSYEDKYETKIPFELPQKITQYAVVSTSNVLIAQLCCEAINELAVPDETGES